MNWRRELASGASQRAMRRVHGFSMVEVMVTLVILSIGMLGLAKLQALAIASTGVASLRSIAALEASSLAAMMRANRDFWSGSAPAVFSVSGTTVTDATGVLTAAASCQGAGNTCTNSQLAAYDVQQWAAELGTALPRPNATVACPSTSVPMNCTVQLSWQEKAVAINTNEANAMTAQPAPCTGGPDVRQNCYVLYVVP